MSERGPALKHRAGDAVSFDDMRQAVESYDQMYNAVELLSTTYKERCTVNGTARTDLTDKGAEACTRGKEVLDAAEEQLKATTPEANRACRLMAEQSAIEGTIVPKACVQLSGTIEFQPSQKTKDARAH